ncbi:ABC-2 type transport system permease protein [Kibdelosporangium banguiense]|uniref:ABC-2 type transport system permease protein n=1 Tax=Kibdelosporangium banguiense TaxID=1365924 RepID=A0ABS4TSJ0_9PSEU|nr:ABC transporter permease [Kibdelosporangium banguiense]MBP2327361.1 ABC-2 type transport system permease protein [Kibdelosporangium banguiense]
MATSFFSATRLVAEREIKSFVRLKGFWIGFGFLLVGLFAVAILPTVLDGGRDAVAGVGPAASKVLDGADLDVRQVGDVAAAEQLVRSEEVKAAVVPDGTGQSATGVRVIALDGRPTKVVAALSTAPPVDLLDPADAGRDVQMVVIQVFALLFLVFGMGGVAIAQSTVTEKQTRVVEILVATVPVRALLAGKIVGHAVLTIAQAAVLVLAAPIALKIGKQDQLLTLLVPALGWFIPFLCLGFVLLAAIWAVAGSLVSRQEDLGSTMGLVMLLVFGPYIGVLIGSENETVMTVMSYVPFSSALAMPVRMFTGAAQAWEAVLALGVLAGAVVLIVLLASRLYSGSLLQTRGKVALAKAWAKMD